MNEAAYAYHRHCLSAEGEINKTFLRTMELVADELFDEGVKTNPSVKPEYIKARILERRYGLQYQFDSANIKEGCRSQDSERANAHYTEFSRFDRTQISHFISKETQEQ